MAKLHPIIQEYRDKAFSFNKPLPEQHRRKLRQKILHGRPKLLSRYGVNESGITFSDVITEREAHLIKTDMDSPLIEKVQKLYYNPFNFKAYLIVLDLQEPPVKDWRNDVLGSKST